MLLRFAQYVIILNLILKLKLIIINKNEHSHALFKGMAVFFCALLGIFLLEVVLPYEICDDRSKQNNGDYNQCNVNNQNDTLRNI